MISTSSVVRPRWTSTLSITTWKNSGETSAKSCRKNEADQHLAEQPAVLVHRLQEPGDVEAPRQLAERGAPRHQHQAPGPARLEIGAAQNLRTAHGRLDQHVVAGGLGEDDEGAVVAFRDRRQRQLGEAPPLHRDGARLEVELLGAAQHLADTDRHAAEAVADLRRVDRDPEKTQQQRQTLQALIAAGARRYAVHTRSPGPQWGPRTIRSYNL